MTSKGQKQSPVTPVSSIGAQPGKTSWHQQDPALIRAGATSQPAQHPRGPTLILTGDDSTGPSCRATSPRVQIKAIVFLANTDSSSFPVNLYPHLNKKLWPQPPSRSGGL